jgi:hypothetical protein
MVFLQRLCTRSAELGKCIVGFLHGVYPNPKTNWTMLIGVNDGRLFETSVEPIKSHPVEVYFEPPFSFFHV